MRQMQVQLGGSGGHCGLGGRRGGWARPFPYPIPPQGKLGGGLRSLWAGREERGRGWTFFVAHCATGQARRCLRSLWLGEGEGTWVTCCVSHCVTGHCDQGGEFSFLRLHAHSGRVRVHTVCNHLSGRVTWQLVHWGRVLSNFTRHFLDSCH